MAAEICFFCGIPTDTYVRDAISARKVPLCQDFFGLEPMMPEAKERMENCGFDVVGFLLHWKAMSWRDFCKHVC